MADFDALVKGLRSWAKGNDPHRRAAVELLIWQEKFLRSRAFVAVCVETSAGTGGTWISWGNARDFERVCGASESERAILRIAVALGSDEYRLSRMNDEQAEAIVKAFAGALGVEEVSRGR
jgi:hypothetical protein